MVRVELARALEAGFDRRLGGVEHGRHLGAVVPEDVAEHEYHPLVRWKTLECRDERQSNRLRGFVSGVQARRFTSARIQAGEAMHQD